jgi:hypothetical protein
MMWAICRDQKKLTMLAEKQCIGQRFGNCRVRPLPGRRGALCPLGGGSFSYEGRVYFERNMGAR